MVFYCTNILACDIKISSEIDYKVGDKVQTIQEFTDKGLGYVEGRVLNIFETPDITYVPPHNKTIWLAVVDCRGSVYNSGCVVLSVNWLKKFNR